MNAKTRRRSIRRNSAKVRYAVVGLGWIAQSAVLPGFANARSNSELVALVSDDPVKLRKLGRKYGAKVLTDYAGYDALLTSGEIDAVYIALPNHLHHPYTLRAAAAGIHVLCEKPMAMDEDECEDMIQACEKYDVRLMIAYRLHFEKANLRAIDAIAAGRIGEARAFSSDFAAKVEEPNIRLEAETGGGTLWDIGIYCINAARYLFRAEPVEVTAFAASSGAKKFREVDEMTSVLLRFPGDRLATFTCSFGAADVSAYRVLGTKGNLTLANAYAIGEEKELTIGRAQPRSFAPRDQFGPELVYFSNCVRSRRQPEPDGREGLADVRVIRALLRSVETRSAVKLDEFRKPRRPDAKQQIDRPEAEEPELVHVDAPSKD
jgi:glucose-fructose oxidoreductase